MKITRYFKLLAFSALAFSVSSAIFSDTRASQYSNSYRNGADGPSRDVQVEYSGVSRSMGFFDEAQPKQPQGYDGSAETRIEQRRIVKQRVNVKNTAKNKAMAEGKTYRDGSIFGGSCCSAVAGQDPSIFPGHGCSKEEMRGCVAVKPAPQVKPCTKPSCRTKRKVMAQQPAPMRENFVQNYVNVGRRDVYRSIHAQCNKFAPIQLEWVDFRLNESDLNGSLPQKLGNYRFRIFGCRRFDKQAFLDKGRTMQKDMRFMSVFENQLKDCFNIVKIPDDVCTEVTPSPLPEYLITAEVNNYFMNICDKYNWDESVREDERIGSSEITVKWSVTDINKTKTYWTGETNGYGELINGEPNGEIILVERAFADAVNNLRNLPGFQRQLTKRFTPAEKENQRIALIDYERAVNPVKCQYTKHEIEENEVEKYVYTPEKTTITETKTTVIEKTPPAPQLPEKPAVPEKIVKQETSVKTTVTEKAPVIPLVKEQEKVKEKTNITTTVAPLPPVPAPTVEERAAVTTVVETTTDDGAVIDTATLLEKERPSEALDVSLLPTPVKERYGKAPEETIEVNLPAPPITPIPVPLPVSAPSITPAPVCNNMTLFGPDCDCNNKTHRGCEPTKDMRGCEPGKDMRGCEAETLLGCDKEQTCKIDVEEKGGVQATGTISKQAWISVPVENKGAIEAQNSLCIIEREPYDAPLTPEDVYKIRASVISITNHQGKKGAGLIVSDQFVLTSADLITKDNNSYDMQTINGVKFKGHAVRINPDKNTALLFLEQKTEYTPLSLNLNLPPINKETYLTLGILDFDTGEGYLEDSGKISGYRYSENRGTEIIVDTFVQNVTLGGALIDKYGTISGIAHSEASKGDKTDLFLPLATALKSVGLEICGKQITDIPVKNTEISDAILFNTGSKEPLPMSKTERK